MALYPAVWYMKLSISFLLSSARYIDRFGNVIEGSYQAKD